MDKNTFSSYFYKLSRSNSFRLISAIILLAHFYTKPFCYIYNSIFGKIFLIIFAIALGYFDITAGIFGFGLIIILYEKCRGYPQENFCTNMQCQL